MAKKTFEERLRILHEVGNVLSRTRSIDDLCLNVVKLGRERLGFDRLSIWFVDKDPNYVVGSFGIDENGRIREETNERVTIDSDPLTRHIRINRLHSTLQPNVPLRDHNGNIVGRGTHIVAAIWNGEEVIGYLSTDNLLVKEALDERDRELLELFASNFGHLFSLKKTEEALQKAYTQLKEIQYQLIQAAKMEVVGGLASGVAHEVKNPLAIILQGVEYLAQKIGSSDENNYMTLQRMKGAVKRANDIIKGLLDFAILSRLEFTSEDLNLVAEDSLLLVRHELDKYHVEVIREFDKNLPRVTVDRNKIEQVFVNLFLNAVHHMHGGGQLKIKTRSEHSPQDGKAVFVEVEDTGSGIAENVLDKIFDPFFTTRRGDGGAGLGLSIVRNIIDMHNGKIAIGNKKEGHGARIVLMFKA